MRKNFSLILLALLLISSLACRTITEFGRSYSGGQLASVPGYDPNRPTPTPFQPVAPTPIVFTGVTESHNEIPKDHSYYKSFLPTALPTLPPVKKAEGRINILVLGSDFRPGGGYRTDVILLVSVNSSKNTVSLLSFPRDLYVNIPYWGMDRINTVMVRGGFPLMSDTMQSNFGFKPDYYVMTNFNGYKNIIDSLEGIDVNAAQPLYDKCDLPNQDKYGKCTVQPGVVHMDGETALWYVRSRYSSSDFDRMRRAQEEIQGVFNKILTAKGITAVPTLYNHFKKSAETNLTLDVVLSMVSIAPTLKEADHVKQYVIGPEMVSNYITETGAMVLWPNQYAIQGLVQQIMGE
jgi:LCP family protein required for cell wall assembly